MIFNLSISCDNAAFGDNGDEAAAELARLLRVVANRIESDGDVYPDEQATIRDANGNRVGYFELESEVTD